jgi:hypothetical protein
MHQSWQATEPYQNLQALASPLLGLNQGKGKASLTPYQTLFLTCYKIESPYISVKKNPYDWFIEGKSTPRYLWKDTHLGEYGKSQDVKIALSSSKTPCVVLCYVCGAAFHHKSVS